MKRYDAMLDWILIHLFVKKKDTTSSFFVTWESLSIYLDLLELTPLLNFSSSHGHHQIVWYCTYLPPTVKQIQMNFFYLFIMFYVVTFQHRIGSQLHEVTFECIIIEIL